MSDRVTPPFLGALADRVVVADGAMGTMLQSADLTLDDFAGHEGCNEILNVTRPDVVRQVHRGYLEAGADAVETNTFGANLANLAEYGIEDKIFELSRRGAELARETADEFGGRFVLGSVGPGTKLPTLGHVPFATLRDAYVEQVKGLLDGGVDAVIVETSQDLLQTKAAITGAKRGPTPRRPRPEPGVSSLYQAVPFRQDASVLMVGERTNADGSKAFREAMLAGRYQDCVEIARDQTRDGAHLLDLNVDYVGRDGVADMRALAGRLATASTLPIMLDSTEPDVLRAGLECLGGRCAVNSVNYEDGDGPDSRFQRIMRLVREHGAAVVGLCIDEEGQARTAEWKVRVATRLVEDLTANWGVRTSDIIIDTLTFPISTGQEEVRRDAVETIEAIRELKRRYPDVQATLGISNVSFGLNPAARQVLNSVFLHECVQAGLDTAIVHASEIVPMARIPDEQRAVALDLVYDRRRDGYDPLQRLMELFEGVSTSSSRASRAEELAALPLFARLERRIVDGERNGLEADLDAALPSACPACWSNPW